MAVLLALLLVLVMIPLAALALSGHVRVGTLGETQRSSDTGALAGARLIPLGDPGFMLSYLAGVSGEGGSPALPVGSPDPLAEACERALEALAVDSGLGSAYALPAACEARYLPDLNFIEGLQSCLESVAGPPPVLPVLDVPSIDPADLVPDPLPTPTLPEPLPSLPGLPGDEDPEEPEEPEEIPLPPPTDPITIDPNVVVHFLYRHFGNLIPALLKPGIQVTLTRDLEGGPIDEFIDDGTAANVESRTAKARRRFKNIVVVPIVERSFEREVDVDLDGDGETEVVVWVDLEAGSPIDLNPALEESYDDLVGLIRAVDQGIDDALDTLSTPREIGGGTITIPGFPPIPIPSVEFPGVSLECDLVFDSLIDDLDDIYSPGAGDPPTQNEIIADAERKDEVVWAFIVSFDPTDPSLELDLGDPTAILGIPFFDFVPLCFEGGVAIVADPDQLTCAANAQGGFRASLVRN